jgi:hypothetical protein
MRLRQVKQTLRELTLIQLLEIEPWLAELIEKSRSLEKQATGREANPEEKDQTGRKTYRLENVRCGRASCKCTDGKPHGPYWYAYWSEGGKTRSQYIGKRLPKGVKPPRALKFRNVR